MAWRCTGVFEQSGYQLKDAMRPIASPLLSRHRAMSPFMVQDFWQRQGTIDATMDNFRQNMDDDGVNLLIYPGGQWHWERFQSEIRSATYLHIHGSNEH